MHITFLFYQGMTALDVVGPHEILSRLPGARVHRVAKHSGPIPTDSQLFLMADESLSEISHTDVLLIPGSGSATTLKKEPEILEWVRRMHMTTLWTTSVCTGSLILGAAGILKDLRATTHWAAFERLEAYEAISTRGRYVIDGKVVTAAGVSAGIDMALFLSSKIAGPLFAQTIQLGIEYDPYPPYDAGSPEKANCAIRQSLFARMQAAFE
jgi:transcriptional regulator GlxA family with amidase domain